MSVALLQNDYHVHEILFVQESVFHMLMWSALHYTAHSRYNNIGSLMDPYNKVKVDQYGNMEGGSRKKNMI